MPSKASLLALLMLFSACTPFGEEKRPDGDEQRTAEQPVTTEEPATEQSATEPSTEAPSPEPAPTATADGGAAREPESDGCLLGAVCQNILR